MTTAMNEAEKLAERLDEERATRQSTYGLCYPELLEASELLRRQAEQIKLLREALEEADLDLRTSGYDPEGPFRKHIRAALAATKEET